MEKIKRIIIALEKRRADPVGSRSIFDSVYFMWAAGTLSAAVLVFAIFMVDFIPSLSHLDVEVFSGSPTGNYYRIVEKAAKTAKTQKGTVRNVSTKGSIDNIARLGGKGRAGRFALVQNGLPWGKGQELVAHLTSPETVFFIGPGADRIKTFSDIKNFRIGIGPKGSGSAHLAERIFSLPNLAPLGVTLSHHENDAQLRLLTEKKLDLGVFVISEGSDFIEKAVREHGLEIASFRQGDSIAQKLPFLRPGLIREGLYDPVRNLPSSDRQVLKTDTLIITDGEARRSQIIGLLSVMNELNPGFINYNRSISNMTGLPESSAARDYFNNQGPEILDRYAPRLMNYLPLSSLVQLVMVVSVFFNAMGVANRYRLWRVDANRLDIEGDILAYFGQPLLPAEISSLPPRDAHRDDASMATLSVIITRLEALERRCRTQSTSMLVPMGSEMAYRYQEDIISKNLIALRVYRDRLTAVRGTAGA